MSLLLRSTVALTAILAVVLGVAAGSLYLSADETAPESALITYSENFPESEEMLNRMAAELQYLNAESLSSIETAAGGDN